MRIIPLFLTAALLVGCGRGGERDADSQYWPVAADTPVPLPLAQTLPDSLEVVAHVGAVTLEHLWAREGGYERIREARVRVRGQSVLVEEFSQGLEVVAYWPLGDAHTLVLIGSDFAGTACDRQFRVLEVGPGAEVHLSDEFGSCAWAPEAMWIDRSGTLWMRFPPWAPFRVEMQEDYVPGSPETYVYRGAGRLEAR